MKKLFIAVLVALSLVGCSDEDAKPNTTTQAQVRTKESFANRVEKGVSYDVNAKGVLIFEKARDMFRNFNDYREDEGELTFISEEPLHLRINKKLDDDKLQPFKEYNEMAFLYAIYRTFMNTNTDEITVESYPIAVNTQGKEKALKKFLLKSTVTREKALYVLNKYTGAKSFDDLVQLTENKEYRTIGISGSKLWDNFIYNEKERSNIVTDLLSH